MKIGELSKKTGVSVRAIRHYEQKHLLVSKRMDNGYRVFDESAVDDIKTIQLYLGLGLTTEQIGEILSCKNNNLKPEMDDLCEELLETYEKKLDTINSQMNTLATVKKQIRRTN